MKRKLFFLGTLALMVAGGIFWSCQKDDLMNPENGVMLKFAVLNDCECVEEVVAGNFETTETKNTEVKADVTVWNDNEYFYIKVSPQSGTMEQVFVSYPINYFTTNNSNCNSTKLNYNHESDNEGPVSEYTFSFPLNGEWACTDAEFALEARGLDGGNVQLEGAYYYKEFTYTTGGGGGGTKYCNVPGAITYTLYEICENCDTELSGQAISCGEEREAEYTFTYDGEIDYVKIQGGLNNFTGDDAVVTLYLGGEPVDLDVEECDYTVTQVIPGASSNRRITVEGPASCTPLVINITWRSDNQGTIITGEWTAEDDDGNLLGEAVPGLVCEE